MILTIVEPEASGHRMVSNVRHLGREAQRRGWKVHLLTTEAAIGHPAYAQLVAGLDQPVSVSLMDHVEFPAKGVSRMALLRYQWSRWKTFRAGLSGCDVAQNSNAVFLNHLEYCDKMMALRGSPFGSLPLVALTLAVSHHHKHCGIRGPAKRLRALNERVFQRVLSVPQLRSLITIDPLLREYSIGGGHRYAEKIVAAPDMAHLSGLMSRDVARQTLGLRDRQVGVLLFGSLTQRKGLDAFIGALVHDRASEDLVAVVAGTQDRDATRILASPVAERLRSQGRLLEFPGFQSETQEAVHFGAADIVWLGYRGFSGMSGVALKAAAAGLPVLACREGLIGWLAGKEQIGPTVDIEDAAAVASTLSRLGESPEERARYGEQGRRLAGERSPDRFAGVICDALARAADASEAPKQRGVASH
ncbi:glycosyltransferase [Gemmatimonadota bacterium]